MSYRSLFLSVLILMQYSLPTKCEELSLEEILKQSPEKKRENSTQLGVVLSLDANTKSGSNKLFLPFTDTSSGNVTYLDITHYLKGQTGMRDETQLSAQVGYRQKTQKGYNELALSATGYDSSIKQLGLTGAIRTGRLKAAASIYLSLDRDEDRKLIDTTITEQIKDGFKQLETINTYQNTQNASCACLDLGYDVTDNVSVQSNIDYYLADGQYKDALRGDVMLKVKGDNLLKKVGISSDDIQVDAYVGYEAYSHNDGAGSRMDHGAYGGIRLTWFFTKRPKRTLPSGRSVVDPIYELPMNKPQIRVQKMTTKEIEIQQVVIPPVNIDDDTKDDSKDDSVDKDKDNSKDDSVDKDKDDSKDDSVDKDKDNNKDDKSDSDHDKGHGNDDDGVDKDNPGQGTHTDKDHSDQGTNVDKDKDDKSDSDHDKGHGNDDDGYDEDNPGQGTHTDKDHSDQGTNVDKDKDDKSDSDHDKGHGNDDDRYDEDNPGQGTHTDKDHSDQGTNVDKDKDDKSDSDHDKGHGNDDDGYDEDNPGKSSGTSKNKNKD